jgi:hypothetical protein
MAAIIMAATNSVPRVIPLNIGFTGSRALSFSDQFPSALILSSTPSGQSAEASVVRYID